MLSFPSTSRTALVLASIALLVALLLSLYDAPSFSSSSSSSSSTSVLARLFSPSPTPIVPSSIISLAVSSSHSDSFSDSSSSSSEEEEASHSPSSLSSSIGGLSQELGGTSSERLAVSTILSLTSLHLSSISPSLRLHCLNTHERCAFWASVGECEDNPGFMQVECAPACRCCELLDVKVRCPKLVGQRQTFFQRTEEEEEDTDDGDKDDDDGTDKDEEDAGKDDEDSDEANEKRTMSALFARIRSGEFSSLGSSVLLEDPFVVEFTNFMSQDECTRLITLGNDLTYERSTDVGSEKFDGTYDKLVSETRTSSNSWCDERCSSDPLLSKVLERIELVTASPKGHSESLQILKYTDGQFYRRHHDYIEGQEDRQCGPRVLTLLLYLSDVEQGGGTHFPLIGGPDGLTVQPKMGKALLWPSVLVDDVMKKDERTLHEAMDVIKGTKYAANAWIHQFHFEDANDRGCAG